MKIVEISIARKKIKLPKMFIPEITNSRNLKKRILQLSSFQIPENRILSNFQIPVNSKLMSFKIPKKILFNS